PARDPGTSERHRLRQPNPRRACTSYLFLGRQDAPVQLNIDQVGELVEYLQQWLECGKFAEAPRVALQRTARSASCTHSPAGLLRNLPSNNSGGARSLAHNDPVPDNDIAIVIRLRIAEMEIGDLVAGVDDEEVRAGTAGELICRASTQSTETRMSLPAEPTR